jgi:undecaprenyl-diphosphatase
MTFAELDLTIFHAINNLAFRNAMLDAIAYFCAVWLIVGLAIGALIFGLRHQKFRWLIEGGVAILLTLVISAIIGKIVGQVRPPFITDANTFFLPWSAKSFPSDHASVSFAIAWLFFREYPKKGIYALIFADLIALSRVFVGVHFPIDIICGALIGIISAEMVLLWRKK